MAPWRASAFRQAIRSGNISAPLALAKQVGAAVRIVQTQEHSRSALHRKIPTTAAISARANCTHRLTAIAAEENFALIVDGNNASDLADDRPGSLAARQNGVRSPLAELGITKPQVREMAKLLGLPVWDKPSMPCLSSRVPHGTPIVPGLLKQIEKAEDVLLQIGLHRVARAASWRCRPHRSAAAGLCPSPRVRASKFAKA